MSIRSSNACSAAPEPTAREALRTRTRATHEAVDALFGRFDLTTAEGYRAFLHAHALAFLPLEGALDEFGADRLLPDWGARRRAPNLRADLADFAIDPPPTETVTVSSPAQAWGILYVLEGSRFGGRIITRGVSAGLPTRYIGAGHAPGAWSAFLARMEPGLVNHHDREIAIGAAHAAFARFAAGAEAVR